MTRHPPRADGPRMNGLTLTPAVDENLLVDALQRGDADAFAALVDRWSPALLRVARRYVRTHASAEELVQETWKVPNNRPLPQQGLSHFSRGVRVSRRSSDKWIAAAPNTIAIIAAQIGPHGAERSRHAAAATRPITTSQPAKTSRRSRIVWAGKEEAPRTPRPVPNSRLKPILTCFPGTPRSRTRSNRSQPMPPPTHAPAPAHPTRRSHITVTCCRTREIAQSLPLAPDRTLQE